MLFVARCKMDVACWLFVARCIVDCCLCFIGLFLDSGVGSYLLCVLCMLLPLF